MNFIKDKYGQWAHPGKNTLIPNADGRITMQGVNQPVLGIDDLGNQTVMMPGGEYQFPGNSVYEIPLQDFTKHFRQGGSLPKAQYGYNKGIANALVNLPVDPLLNPIGNLLHNYGLDKVKNKIADNVNPYSYHDPFQRLYDAIFTTENETDENIYEDEKIERRDLLHMLMGLDQENNSIPQQTQYTPTKGHKEGDVYYNSPVTETEIKHELSRVGKNRKENFFLDKNYQRDEEDRWTDEELEEFWISQQNQHLDGDIYDRLIYGENNDDFNNTYNDKEITRHKISVEEDPDKYVHFTDTPQYDEFLKSDDYDAWANNKNIERENEIDYPDAESLMTISGNEEEGTRQTGGFYGGVLGNFILNQGEDEQGKYFSYYDKWDLDPFKGDGDWKETLSNFGQKHILGVSPTQIYNRMYYTTDDQGNYVFKDGGSLPKFQDVGELNDIEAQEKANKEFRYNNWTRGDGTVEPKTLYEKLPSKLRELEKSVDDYLGNPSHTAMYKFPGLDSSQDGKRHAYAAALTADKVGFGMSNIFGLAHEFGATNSGQEHLEDIGNNFIGSLVGSVPFTDQEDHLKMTEWLSDNGWLFGDYQDGGSLPKAQFGLDRHLKAINDQFGYSSWDEFEDSKVGKFVGARDMRGDAEFLMGTVGKHFGYEPDEGVKMALDASAIVYPAADFANAGHHYNKEEYLDAGLYAGFGILPFSAGPLVRGTKKHIINPIKNTINKIKPKTVYNVAPTNPAVNAMEAGTYGTNIDPKTQKILDDNIWSTQNPIETTKYAMGDHNPNSIRKGLLTGDDMTLTEFKVRFPWLTGNVATNKNILDLKKSQGVMPNTNEFLIPKDRGPLNKFLYPKVKTTNLKPIPKHLMDDPMFKPDNFSLNFGSSNNFSKPYTYVGDQIRGATGHVDMPYGFNHAVNYTDHGAYMIDDGIDYNNIVNKWQDERGFNMYKRKYGGSLPQFQKKGETTYPVEIIQYPLGYSGMPPGHIESRYLGDLSGTDYEGQKGYVNRWVNSGNREVTYNPEEDYETGVRTSIMNLNEEEFAHYMKTAQSFTSGDKTDIPFTNLNIPTAFGGDDTDYDFVNSNCADGVCNALGLDGNYTTAGVTTPQQVMDAIKKDKRTKSSTGQSGTGETILKNILNPIDAIQGYFDFQEGGESSTIVPLQKEGKSEEIDAFGYKGYFDFSQEPINMSDDQDGHKGYLFVYTEGPTAGGSYWRPLENKYSGSRWENSGQVEEYNAYFTNPNLIDEHWDKGSAVALKIREAVKDNVLYSELPEYLKDVNTWRTISPNRDLEKELGELDKKQDGNEVTVSFDDLEKGIRHIESINGTLMKNKQSSASGFYGDLFNNLDYDGTRDEFIADTTFQKNHFIQRYNGEIKDVPGLESNGIDIYNEYKGQVDFTYTPTQIAALSNMLGRQGTRQYFGEVLRDGKTLEEVFPHLYGADRQLGADGKPLENKTPEQYISGFTEAISKKVGGEFNNKVKRLKQQLEKYNEGGVISPLAYQDLVKLKMIKPKMQEGGSVQQSSYVTKRGDNLSRIAANNNMSLTELLSYNPKYAANPSLVRVGETIQLSDAPVTNNTTPNINYVIKKGDNLSKIAEQYGVRYQDIQKLNNISDPRRIQPGQKIRLPDNATINNNNKNIKEQKKQSESVYVPEVSDINVNESGNVNTPWAKRIMNNDGSWRTEGQRNIKTNINKMNQADRIIQGKNEIEGDNSKVIDYEIKRGDNLSLIAQRNGVTTEQLMTDNNISNANNIQVGKKIKIKKSAGKPYIVVDEQAGRMHLYYPGQDKPSESYPILTGQNTGDAQTVTKTTVFKDGIKLDQAELNKAMKDNLPEGTDWTVDNLLEFGKGYTSKIDWGKGNKQTGAGVYTIGKVNEDSGFYDDGKLNRKTPSFVLNNSNDDEVPMVIHTSPTAGSRVRNLNDNDASNNRVTNGCINGKCTDLLSLYNNPDVGEGTQVFVLPEDVGNNFVYENGEINFYASSKYQTEEGKKYIDEYGNEQVGHGIANKTKNSYKPINITFDKNYYQTNSARYDGTAEGEEEEFVTNTQPFLNSLADSKKDMMDKLGMDGDTYNDLAMIAFGIYGYESGMGDEGSAAENLVKAGQKKMTQLGKEKWYIPELNYGNTSPDVRSKHDTYGVDNKWNSIGWTQSKWGYIEGDENAMKIMNKLGINEDNYAEWMMDPEKNAKFTIARLYDFHQKSQASINSRNKHREDGTFVEGDDFAFDPVEKYGEEKEVYDPFTYLPKQWSPKSPGYTDIVNKYTDYIDLTETDINDVDNNLIIKGEYSDNNQVSNKRVSEKSIGEKILNPLETIENEYNSSLIKPVVDMAGDVISDAADDVSEWWDEVDLNPFWKLGGEFGIRNQVQFYNDYISGLYKDTKQEKKAKQMYDKLNRIYYNDSKQNNMHQLDIMKSIENQG